MKKEDKKKTNPFHGTIEVKEGPNGKPIFTSKILEGREQVAQQQAQVDPEKWEYEVSESADLFAFIVAGFYQAVAISQEKTLSDKGVGIPLPPVDEAVSISPEEEQAAAIAQASKLRQKG